MRFIKAFVFLLALTFMNDAEARNFRVGFIGAYGLTNVTQSLGGGAVTIGESDQSYNLGGGVLIEFGLIGPLGLEIGGIYQPRGYRDAASSDEVKYDTNLLTAMLRFDFGESSGDLKLPISLGLGAYYSEAIENHVTSIDRSANTAVRADFSDSSLPLGPMSRFDRGLVASIAADYPISENFLFTFDFRFLYGLSEVFLDEATTGVSGNWQEISTVMGLVLQF